MKIRKAWFVISILFLGVCANAEVKHLDDILAKATPQEKSDLGNLLKQIRMIPAKDPATGKSVFKIVAVEKGSVYDREGVKIGDLIVAGSSEASGTKMELKASKKTSNKQEPTNQ